MGPVAASDRIADWYEEEFHGGQPTSDPLGIDRTLRDLLGPGNGACLEVGCGTGVYARAVRELGRTPVGLDLSAGMLRHAGNRLPVIRADATGLPVRDNAVPSVIAVMVQPTCPTTQRCCGRSPGC
jgi:SAM-dependent methyltransferase